MTTTTSGIDDPTIHAAHLQQSLATREEGAPRLVDVRTRAEYDSQHIPGSVNVPLDILHASTEEPRDALAGQKTVPVCRSGQRTERARTILAEAGLASTWVLSGGVVGWESAGGELNRDRHVREIERQVRFAAGALVLTGVLGSLLVPHLKWLAAFVGGGLAVTGATNTCALGRLLARMPWNRRGGFSASSDETISRLRREGVTP